MPSAFEGGMLRDKPKRARADCRCASEHECWHGGAATRLDRKKAECWPFCTRDKAQAMEAAIRHRLWRHSSQHQSIGLSTPDPYPHLSRSAVHPTHTLHPTHTRTSTNLQRHTYGHTQRRIHRHMCTRTRTYTAGPPIRGRPHACPSATGAHGAHGCMRGGSVRALVQSAVQDQWFSRWIEAVPSQRDVESDRW